MASIWFLAQVLGGCIAGGVIAMLLVAAFCKYILKPLLDWSER